MRCAASHFFVKELAMVYSTTYETRWHDTDASRVLRPSAVLTYFEETADRHIRSFGKSLDDMRDEDKVGFILSRMTMVFYRPVPADVMLTVETWTSEGRGFSTERSFRARVGDEIVAEATSMWALVDVESYRAKREAALRVLARKKANQVLRNKKSIMLEPMNPYERRIIHSEIQKMEGVATNSIGVENNRRIVIYLEEEGMPTAGIKAKSPSEKSKSRSRNRRRSGGKTVDPLSTEAITGEVRKQGESIFGGEEHDPFDIDLSAATYSEEDEVQETEVASDEE